MEPSTPGNFEVLLTGASSFSGLHFAEALAASGARVTATFTRSALEEYDDPLVRDRIQRLLPAIHPVWNIAFGDSDWNSLLSRRCFDLICCHGARVGNFRSTGFSVEEAVTANTRALGKTLTRLKEQGTGAILLTGTYFEPGEGDGSRPLQAFSPYGEAKAKTALYFQEQCAAHGVPLGKYVLPNPFGPMEKPNLTSYLARAWLTGKTPEIQTPDTVRDNAPIPLLAEDYAQFGRRLLDERPEYLKRNPSGGKESNLAFASRISSMLEPLFDLPCPLRAAPASAGRHPPGEPPERFNTDLLPPTPSVFWEDLARYYRERFKPCR